MTNRKGFRSILGIMLAVILVNVSPEVMAQQMPLSNFHPFYPQLSNPARYGQYNHVSGVISHRSQMVGIDGAPVTSNLNLSGPLSGRIGLGGTLTNDQAGIFNNVMLRMGYSFRANFDDMHYIRLGLEGGIIRNQLKLEELALNSQTDQMIYNNTVQGTTWDAGAGLYYRNKQLKIDLAAPRLLQNRLQYYPTETSVNYNMVSHFLANLSWEQALNDDITLEPGASFRTAMTAPFQFDIYLTADWQKTLYLGGGYRKSAGIFSMIALQLWQVARIGYSYEYGMGDIGDLSPNTHEFFLSFNLWNKKAKGSASYEDFSYLEEESEEAPEEEGSVIDSLYFLISKMNKEIEFLKYKLENAPESNEYDEDNSPEEEDNHTEDADDTGNLTNDEEKEDNTYGYVDDDTEDNEDDDRNDEDEMGSSTYSSNTPLTSSGGSDTSPSTVTASGRPAEQPQRFGRGENPEVDNLMDEKIKDIPEGADHYYIILESFKFSRNAVRARFNYNDVGIPTEILYNKERDWHYIVAGTYDEREDAIAKLKEMVYKGYLDTWVYAYFKN